MPRMTLYNRWRSSCSHRVRIALAMKGIAYEYAAVRTDDEPSKANHRARSPTGYVPCLVIDGVAYIESVAIIELLEELVPNPALYPKDAHHRARVRGLVEMINSGIQPLQNSGVLEHLETAPPASPAGSTAPGSIARAWAQHFIARGLDSLERAMAAYAREGKDGPYAYGAAPTAADVFLVPQVYNARRYGVAVDSYARVCSAFEAATQLEAFQKAAPQNQIDADVDVADGVKRAR
jgi:maleylacetoacetate isomerase